MKKTLLLCVASVAVVLALIEAGLWLAQMLPPHSPVLATLSPALELRGDAFWMRRFEVFRQKGLVTFGENQPDPELGWVPRPNQILHNAGKTCSINELGARGHAPFIRDPSRFLVLAVGDSFTFGSDADDADTWPALLEGLDPRIQVLNLGVSGYGTDQMALRLERALQTFRPDLVVAAFIEDDLKRSLLGFRDFKKPKFACEGEELRLTNTPIGTPDEVHEETKAKLARLPKLKLAIFAHNVALDLVERLESNRLNGRIFERMMADCSAAGLELMLLYLPYREELTDKGLRTASEQFFVHFGEAHQVLAVNPRQDFLAHTGATFVKVHYQRKEATIVAQAVHRSIAKSRLFTTFLDRRQGS